MAAEIVSSPKDVAMAEAHPEPPAIPNEEPKFGGFTRFEIELEVNLFPVTHSCTV